MEIKRKIVIVEGNHRLDKIVQGAGLCCPIAYFRLRAIKRMSIHAMAEELGVAVSTITNNRKWMREGKIRCLRRDRCLAALWLTPAQLKTYDQKLEEEKDGTSNGK